MRVKICELCGDRPGQINSRFWFDEDGGYWVCFVCEEQNETEYFDQFYEDEEDFVK